MAPSYNYNLNMKRFLILISIIVTALLTFPTVTHANSRERIEDYKIDVNIEESSTLDITETIRYDFTDNAIDKHGIYRYIPFKYSTEDGEYITTDYEILSVTNENDKKYNYDQYEEYTDFVLKIGDADTTVSGIKTYVIHYRIDRGILFHENLNYDEFYWNLIGTEWQVPIDKATATVSFPKTINTEGQILKCYTGYLGSDEHGCEIKQTDDNQIEIKTSAALQAYNGLTGIITFEHGLIDQPAEIAADIDHPYSGQVEHLDRDYNTPHIFYKAEGTYDFRFHRWGYKDKTESISVVSEDMKNIEVDLDKQPWYTFLQYFPFLLIPLTIWGLYSLWFNNGRDIDHGKTIIAEYAPPKGITPIEAGTVYKENFKTSYISALIIKLAIEGYIKIHYKKKEKFTLEKLNKADDKLEPYEKKIFDNLFSYSSDDKLEIPGDLKNKFYTKLPGIKKAVWKNMLSEKFFTRDPRISKVIYIVLGVIAILAGGAFGVFYLIIFFSPSALLLGLTLGIGLIIVGIASPQRSKIGSEVNRKVRGLKLYMNVAEKDRIKFHNAPEKTPEHFEALLPYAMVLGVEKQWAKQFKDIYTEEPEWYTGHRFATFSALVLTNSLTSATSSIASTIASRPSQSGSGFSSGGFSSGGGFSGGGGGGGGGSSW